MRYRILGVYKLGHELGGIDVWYDNFDGVKSLLTAHRIMDMETLNCVVLSYNKTIPVVVGVVNNNVETYYENGETEDTNNEPEDEPKNIKIYPYEMESESAKELATALDCKRVYPDRNYQPAGNDLIINWGSTTVPKWIDHAHFMRAELLNKPENVKLAVNKLLTFQALRDKNIPTVEFTTDRITASDWGLVYCRHILEGHGGAGIEVVDNEDGILPESKLYTKGIRSRYEWRVHVFKGKVIDYARKRVPHDGEANDLIKNHDNGWIFVHGEVERDYRQEVADLAVNAIKVLGLDFGSVDIIGNHTHRVLEVNTASGITGITLEAYVKAIKEYAGK